ncbi:MAG TPA: hypothetical protein PLL30_16045 [Candidatus Krumholzibacteria bacterium]|nr:hypothetical protein [Candidatus Krumholzibacteria bacterium]HPD73282.1 hypothetical protein [Candidatus Krumholzibacteria bacterium]HRY41998.1 hypothetical protein [Candidatus Krumholzibacteria bacterium]
MYRELRIKAIYGWLFFIAAGFVIPNQSQCQGSPTLYLSWDRVSYVEELVVSADTSATCFVLVDIGTLREFVGYRFQVLITGGLEATDHFAILDDDVAYITPPANLLPPLFEVELRQNGCPIADGLTCVAAINVNVDAEYIEEHPDHSIGMQIFDILYIPEYEVNLDPEDCQLLVFIGAFNNWCGVRVRSSSTPVLQSTFSVVKSLYRK